MTRSIDGDGHSPHLSMAAKMRKSGAVGAVISKESNLVYRFKAASALILLSCVHTGNAVAQDRVFRATGSIERKYFAAGPSGVSRMTSAEPCDRRGHLCDIWYPSDIERAKPRAAIVWANGTADAPVEPKVYDYILSHLASWGFVVVATRDPKTGYGDTVLDSLDFLKEQAGKRRSPLYRRVDLEQVGVAGHSQGATGAINAMLKSRGRIKTTVAFQLPSQKWCNPADLCVLTKNLKAAKSGSIFYVGGTFDFLISPDRQKGGGKLNSLTAYYEATPNRLIKAKGLIKLANHNDILGKPDCKTAVVGSPLTCTLGVYGYLGLPTGWLAWQLQGARDAGAAFRKKRGEFLTAGAWSGQVSNIP
jgi:Chlorophyllase enzyme